MEIDLLNEIDFIHLSMDSVNLRSVSKHLRICVPYHFTSEEEKKEKEKRKEKCQGCLVIKPDLL